MVSRARWSFRQMTRKGDLQAGPGAVWHPGPVDGSGMVAQAWSAGLEPRGVDSGREELRDV